MCVCNAVHVPWFYGILGVLYKYAVLRFLDTHALPSTFLSSCQTNLAIVKNLLWKVQARFSKWKILIWWICRNKGSIYNDVFTSPRLWISSEAFMMWKEEVCHENKKQHETIPTWMLTVLNSWKWKEQHRGISKIYPITLSTTQLSAGNKNSIMC